MRIDVSHLVKKALRHTNDQVVDQSPDRSQCRYILSCSMVQLDVDYVLLWVREVDREMVEVLSEFTAGAFDSDQTGLDRDLDYLRH